MQKNIFLVFCACVCLSACRAQGPLTGTDRDAHGCSPSAGMVWSQVLAQCVQPWQDGIALTQVTPQGSAVFAAYVILSDDGTQAEVFTKDGTFVLKRSFTPDGPQWTDRSHTLKRLPAAWEWYENNTLSYRQETAR